MKRRQTEKKRSGERGLSLLIAVIVASVALLFSFAISNIALKEVVLTRASQDSQSAFYAANSGLECGLYWDVKQEDTFIAENNPQISCAGSSVDMEYDGFGNDCVTGQACFQWTAADNFLMEEGEDGRCFKITVKKGFWNFCPLGEQQPQECVRIESRGYNTCETSNPRRLERALRVTYF